MTQMIETVGTGKEQLASASCWMGALQIAGERLGTIGRPAWEKKTLGTGKCSATISQPSMSRVPKKLMLYDFRRQKWSDWLTETSNVDYPYWSADSRYVYFDNIITGDPKCRRVRVGDGRAEDLFSLKGLRRYFGIWGSWSGQAPDDSRLFVRDVSTQDIYAPRQSTSPEFLP